MGAIKASLPFLLVSAALMMGVIFAANVISNTTTTTTRSTTTAPSNVIINRSTTTTIRPTTTIPLPPTKRRYVALSSQYKAIDSGQTNLFVATVVNGTGGAGAYTYRWTVPNAFLVGNVTASAGIYSTSYCTSRSSACMVTGTTPGEQAVKVSVNSGNTVIGNASASLTVNPRPSVSIKVSPRPQAGNTQVLTVSIAAGTLPFKSFYLIQSSSSASCKIGRSTLESTPNVKFYVVNLTVPNPVNVSYYCASVTDSANPPVNAVSNVVTVKRVSSGTTTPTTIPVRKAGNPAPSSSVNGNPLQELWDWLAGSFGAIR